MSSNGTISIQRVDRLKEIGFNEQQARGLLEIISEESISKADVELSTTLLQRDIKELDTKIETVRAELKKDIETIRTELKRDIKELDTNLKKDMQKIELSFKSDMQKMELSLRNDSLVKMMSFSLATISVLGGLMAFFKFFQP